jgi:hypothetical protein
LKLGPGNQLNERYEGDSNGIHLLVAHAFRVGLVVGIGNLIGVVEPGHFIESDVSLSNVGIVDDTVEVPLRVACVGTVDAEGINNENGRAPVKERIVLIGPFVDATTFVVVHHVHTPEDKAKAVEVSGELVGVSPGADFTGRKSPFLVVGSSAVNTVRVQKVIVSNVLRVPSPNLNTGKSHGKGCEAKHEFVLSHINITH